MKKKGVSHIVWDIFSIIWLEYGHLAAIAKGSKKGIIDDYFFMRLHKKGRKTGLRMGVADSQTDNFCGGGIAVPIRNNGTLEDIGRFCDFTRQEVTPPPDSHIVFNGYAIPMFDDCVQLAKKAHELVKDGIYGVGWDIIVTENGPILLEANVHFGHGIPQSAGVGFGKMMHQHYLPIAKKHAREAGIPL